MKKLLKTILSAVLTISMLAGFPGTAMAATDWPSDVSIAADGGIVMDASSGAVLYGKNAHETYYPASITKILTALITLESCDLDETVTFSSLAVNSLEPNASIVGARAGDQMSVRDCLYALLLQSANEVANALAEHVAGSIEAFAELMNQKAEQLGCLNSHFMNPSGLHNDDHYTSAYDMALIARAAFSNPVFVEIDSTTYYDVKPGQLQQYPDGWRYYAHHKMLKKNDPVYYPGILGGKTGYTSVAGNTLVTCAERDGMRLVAVVLNGHQTHYTDTTALLDFGFRNFESIPISDLDNSCEKLQNDLKIAGISPADETEIILDSRGTITLPLGASFDDVTSTLNYQLGPSAPEHAVARIDYMYGDKTAGRAYMKAEAVPVSVPDQELPDNVIPTSADAEEETEKGLIVNPVQKADKEKEAEPEKEGSGLMPVLKKVLLVVGIIAVTAGIVAGILLFRKNRMEKEQRMRRQRREKRLKEWGYSSNEFDLIMQEHLRAKNQFKKRSFKDKISRRR